MPVLQNGLIPGIYNKPKDWLNKYFCNTIFGDLNLFQSSVEFLIETNHLCKWNEWFPCIMQHWTEVTRVIFSRSKSLRMNLQVLSIFSIIHVDDGCWNKKKALLSRNYLLDYDFCQWQVFFHSLELSQFRSFFL